MEIHQRNRLPALAIVILNYNGVSWFEKLLPGIIHFSTDASIYVIDNASTDHSVSYLKKNFPSVTLIQNNTNSGYAGGYNEGLQFINEEIYCLLNSDVEVTDNWISPILTLFKENESISAIQPKILNYNEKIQFEFAGAAGGFLDNLGYPFCRGRIFYTLENDNGQYNNNQEIFWATGACLFIRSKDFWSQGGFDNDFFAHMEEIDLCWRLKISGKKIFYCAESKVYHAGGGTLNPDNPRKTFLNFRNNLLMLLKNLPANQVFFIIFLRLILDGIAGIKFVFSGNWKHCLAILQAHFSFYRLLPRFLKKRKAGSIIYYNKKYLLYQYFIKKRNRYSDLK